MSLQDFVAEGKGYSGEMFRVLKDTWPSATSKGIRRALAGCERYHLDEGDMRKYKSSEIARFLGRANRLMTDTLFTVTSNSLADYERYIARCCKADVEVVSVGEVGLDDEEEDDAFTFPRAWTGWDERRRGPEPAEAREAWGGRERV